MGRRNVRPRRAGGIVEQKSSEAEFNAKDVHPQKDDAGDIEEPYFVEIDKFSWVCEEHFDVSEIVLLNLKVNEEFYGYKVTEEFFKDSRYSLRFELKNVNEHLGRMKLGHWPVLSENNTCLQFVMKQAVEGLERDVVMVSGIVDGPEEGLTGMVHLLSLKYLTVRPNLGIELLGSLPSIGIRVEILRSVFDECESLLDNTRQLWKRSMMNVMAWLRPEVLTSEARYGSDDVKDTSVDFPIVADCYSSSSSKQVRFDVSCFYEAIKPSKEAPMLDDHLPDLLPQLRPYQRRAAYWMVQREEGRNENLSGNGTKPISSPLCLPLHLIDSARRIFYNPFSGNISLHPSICSSYVPGGILADEMGLGKTIELLSCIFTHRMPSSEVTGGSGKAIQVDRGKNNMKRLKRERVECVCGAVNESYRYKGLWVQCDSCNAWQHADVGYSAKRKSSKAGEIRGEIGNSKKTKRENLLLK